MTTPATPRTDPIGQHLAPRQAIQIPLAAPPPGTSHIVEVMPLNKETGRRYLSHHVYIHDGKRPQIRLDATHLGYSIDGQEQLVVVPIARWWYIESADAIPVTGIAHLAAIWAEPHLQADWPGPSTMMELGGPVTVALPLGYGQPANGATPAIQGEHPLSYELDELLKSASTGRTLADTPKAPKA